MDTMIRLRSHDKRVLEDIAFKLSNPGIFNAKINPIASLYVYEMYIPGDLWRMLFNYCI